MPYKLDPNADISGTSWVADLKVATADVVRAFGAPCSCSEPYKVSGRYTFAEGRRVFTVYDWKSTALYDDRLPSPLAFWNSRDKVCLSIGSNCEDACDFKRWLVNLIALKKA